MPEFKKELLEEIREANDLVDVVSEYITVERSGQSYKALCPFHNEKTPSFSISPDEQLFYCFGCQTGGDVFTFVMEMENIDFPRAVKLLAERAGIALTGLEVEKGKAKERDRLYTINRLACAYFHHLLRKMKCGKKARDYLSRRGFGEETIREFGLGYAASSWDDTLRFLTKKGFAPDAVADAGLVLPRKNKGGFYDRFRDRLIFPITDHRGRVVGFGGRLLAESDQQPKYLNSPKTPIFDKGDLLFGLFLARTHIQSKGEAIVTEGYTDVLSAHEAGLKNTVAALGTSFTRRQSRLISRYCDAAVIAFDADAAGEKATLRGMRMLMEEDLVIRVAELPENEDPDSLIRGRGSEVFAEIIESAPTFIDYQFRRVFGGYSSERLSAEERIRAAEDLFPILSMVPNSIERESYARRLAERLNVSEQAILAELRKFRNNKDKKGNNRNSLEQNRYTNNNNRTGLASSLPDSGQKSAERVLLALLLEDIEDLDFVEEKLKEVDFVDEQHRELFSALQKIDRDRGSVAAGEVMNYMDPEKGPALLARLRAGDHRGEQRRRVLLDCINRIRMQNYTRELEKIQRRITEAEREGNQELVDELVRKYQRVLVKKSAMSREGGDR